MLRKLRSVSVLLSMATLSSGIAYSVQNNTLPDISISQQNEACKGVVKDTAGEAIIGASVIVKGTTNGTMTGIDGDFTLNGVRIGDIIEVSFIGYETKDIKWDGKTISVSLKEDSQELDEVVVTALGIKRSAKALGYAVTEMKAEDLNNNVINPVSALQGKVAGVEISQSDGGLFGSNKILIRGASTLGKNNQPIYVVDGIILDNSIKDGDPDWSTSNSDYGNELKNLNPDDFESVSVLKGAAATALYGSRGLNGAVVITTKSGKGKKGLGINFSQTFGFDKVTSTPKLQNIHMDGPLAGYAGQIGGANINDNFNTYVRNDDGIVSLLSLYRDYEWNGMGYGPRFDSVDKLEWYDGSIIDSKAYKNNFKDAYQTGFNTNTNVAIAGSGEKTSFYASMSFKYADGTLPNNSFERFSLLTKGSYNITKNVEVEASLSFANSVPKNAQTNIGERFIDGTWDRTYNAAYFRDKYKGAHGGLASNTYGDEYGSIPGRNIWWDLWENEYRQKESVFRPSMKLNVNFTDWLKWSSEGSYNYYYVRSETKNPGSGYANEGGQYKMSLSTKEQTNFNTNLLLNKTVGDWSFNGFLRGEYYHSFNQSMSSQTNGGLIIPNQYFLKNSKNAISTTGTISGEKTIYSIAFQAGFSYKDMVFVDVTGRNDWSSSLIYADGHGHYSYFYPSVNASWLIHETFQLPEFISFAKVRGSIAQVGNDTDPYTINSAYGLGTTNLDGNYYYSLSIPSTVYSNNLKPERKTSWEVGADWRFLNNRIALDFTYYKENTRNQIMTISVPSVSGISQQLINAGNIQNSGVEIALNTKPYQSRNFSWDLDFTYTKNNSKIVELSDQVANYIELSGSPAYGNFRIGSVAKVGGEYGILMSDISPKIDKESGLPILAYRTSDRNAYMQRSGEVKEVGSITPDFLGSVGTTIRYKNWSLRALFDMRFGGYVASYGSHYGTAYGYTESSLQYSDAAHGGTSWTSAWDGITYNDGVIPQGIIATGTAIPQPNGKTYTVGSGSASSAGETYAELIAKGVIEPTHSSAWTYRQNSWGNAVLNDNWFVKLNYIAFRELALNYACPAQWASKIGAKGLNLTIAGHNLGYLLNTMPNKENPEAVRGTSASEFRVRSFEGLTSNFTFTINASF